MPLLTRTFIKTALMYLALALALGIALAVGITNGYFPVYIHLLVFGWLTQLIFGVAYWMFPKYSAQLPRGYEWLGWITYGTLNIGLFLRAIFEPIHSMHPRPFSGWMLVFSAILQFMGGLAFFINSWGRIREK